MRKYIRSIIRKDAKKENAKPSRWVKISFDVHQRKKYGSKIRVANQAKGTHKMHLWGSRIALFASK